MKTQEEREKYLEMMNRENQHKNSYRKSGSTKGQGGKYSTINFSKKAAKELKQEFSGKDDKSKKE